MSWVVIGEKRISSAFFTCLDKKLFSQKCFLLDAYTGKTVSAAMLFHFLSCVPLQM